MQVDLSANEVEYISLSLSLRKVIPVIIFFNEMKKKEYFIIACCIYCVL